MIPVGRTVVALSVLVVILVAALGFVLVYVPPSTVKTVTTTSTVVPVGQAIGGVSESLAEHLVLFSSRNVSAIISQYEPNATVVWDHLYCLSGLYPNAGSSNSVMVKLLTDFFDGRFSAAISSMYLGNVTKMTITPMTNGTVIVNSTFGMVGVTATGNFNATVSASDSFVYSYTSNAWMISQETWDWLSYHTPQSVVDCFAG